MLNLLTGFVPVLPFVAERRSPRRPRRCCRGCTSRETADRPRGLAACETREALQDRPVLVVDYGPSTRSSSLAASARRGSTARSCRTPPVAAILSPRPAVILSGGPSSVYAPGAPHVDPALLAAGVPVFGMCYGFQAMVQALGGTWPRTGE